MTATLEAENWSLTNIDHDFEYGMPTLYGAPRFTQLLDRNGKAIDRVGVPEADRRCAVRRAMDKCSYFQTGLNTQLRQIEHTVRRKEKIARGIRLTAAEKAAVDRTHLCVSDLFKPLWLFRQSREQLITVLSGITGITLGFVDFHLYGTVEAQVPYHAGLPLLKTLFRLSETGITDMRISRLEISGYRAMRFDIQRFLGRLDSLDGIHVTYPPALERESAFIQVISEASADTLKSLRGIEFWNADPMFAMLPDRFRQSSIRLTAVARVDNLRELIAGFVYNAEILELSTGVDGPMTLDVTSSRPNAVLQAFGSPLFATRAATLNYRHHSVQSRHHWATLSEELRLLPVAFPNLRTLNLTVQYDTGVDMFSRIDFQHIHRIWDNELRQIRGAVADLSHYAEHRTVQGDVTLEYCMEFVGRYTSEGIDFYNGQIGRTFPQMQLINGYHWTGMLGSPTPISVRFEAYHPPYGDASPTFENRGFEDALQEVEERYGAGPRAMSDAERRAWDVWEPPVNEPPQFEQPSTSKSWNGWGPPAKEQAAATQAPSREQQDADEATTSEQPTDQQSASSETDDVWASTGGW